MIDYVARSRCYSKQICNLKLILLLQDIFVWVLHFAFCCWFDSKTYIRLVWLYHLAILVVTQIQIEQNTHVFQAVNAHQSKAVLYEKLCC